MRSYYNPFHSGWQRTSSTIRILIGINTSVFFTQILLQTAHGDPLVNAFALVPHKIIFSLQVWRLFSYMFLHGGLLHIVMNMFGLWIFGREIEQILGRQRFLNFFLLTGASSGLLTTLINVSSETPVIGASGAVFAVLLAFALYFPNRVIYFNLFFPMPAKIFVIILAIVTIISTVGQSGGGISHSTHLGGLLFGWMFLRKFPRILSFNWKKYRTKKRPDNVADTTISKVRSLQSILRIFRIKIRKKRSHDIRREVNHILDKMNRLGYHHLTKEEIEILRKGANKYHQNENPN